MSLKEEIKKRMFAAMKAGKIVEKEVLRVAMGEITANEGRESRDLTDPEVQALLKKLVKSNREALAAGPDAERKAALEEEIVVIEEFLPKALGVDEIVAALAGVAEAIRSAKGPGPAMGLAMKELKARDLPVEAPVVTAALAKIRGE